MFLRKSIFILTLVATLASGQIANAEPSEDMAPTLEEKLEIDSNLVAIDFSNNTDDKINVRSSYHVSKKVVEHQELLMSWPVNNHKISSKFGWRTPSCRSCSSNHKGVDFETDLKTEVKAAMQGIVTTIDYNGGFGHYVIIKHIAVIEEVEYNWETVYAHLTYDSAYEYINVGDVVDCGDVIALSGQTGVATGPHLHFELRVDGEPINPMRYLLRYAY